MQMYKESFYDTRNSRTIYAAEVILTLVQSHIPPINSAVDLGCGVGTWLSVLERRGAGTILGLDGAWVDESKLVIPVDSFRRTDLAQAVDLPNTYDLAISLEVAEHLPEASANAFVESLTRLSDVVLFSAAIPGQGGVRHVNEQWPSYWLQKFESFGYRAMDAIRPKIWNDDRIPYWYRQNCFLLLRKSRWPDVTDSAEWLLQVDPIVHPELFLNVVARLYRPPTVVESIKHLLRAMFRRVSREFGLNADSDS